MTICVDPYTGVTTRKLTATCGSGHRTHPVPDSGSLLCCQSIYTGNLRYSTTGTCSNGKRSGVIPE